MLIGRRKMKWPLLGAAAATLALGGVAQAAHDTTTPYSPTNVLHVGGDVLNLPPGGGRTLLRCNVNLSCLFVQNINTGGVAQALRGTHNASGDAPGVWGETTSTTDGAIGVLGTVGVSNGSGSAGVRGMHGGTGSQGDGVWGSHGGSGSGVRGTSPQGAGVFGSHTGSVGTGLFSAGVFGTTSSDAGFASGVFGRIFSNAAYASGVRGTNDHASCCGFGVFGEHTGAGIGVYGEALNGFAVSGFSPNNWSGYFQGSVRVVGNLQKNSGSFTIDHPLDPANKYLSHSFVESPDMKNVYDGVVRTDRRGYATVRLPRYFGALNRDFRYQLTGIGRAAWGARIVVWREIANNRFVIRSTPNVKVSWQVTGIRKDRWANAHRIVVEEAKKPAERGKYLNPELYGKPATANVVKLPGFARTLARRN